MQDLLVRSATVKTIPYSEFQSLLQQQKLNDIVVGPTAITGKSKEPGDGGVTRFSTVRVDTALVTQLSASGVTFTGEPGPGWLAAILGWFMPAVGFFVLWMVAIRPMLSGQGVDGLMSIGKSRAKVYVERTLKLPSPMSRAWTRRRRIFWRSRTMPSERVVGTRASKTPRT